MNAGRYRLVFNRQLGVWQVASELTARHRLSGQEKAAVGSGRA